ncbi:MAG: hypothetical protein JWO08_3728, partial [Verrucomicrobiaceae bacterium]|nr:hypothetical protein [Verrucomicrobiaceae bacterium]
GLAGFQAAVHVQKLQEVHDGMTPVEASFAAGFCLGVHELFNINFFDVLFVLNIFVLVFFICLLLRILGLLSVFREFVFFCFLVSVFFVRGFFQFVLYFRIGRCLWGRFRSGGNADFFQDRLEDIEHMERCWDGFDFAGICQPSDSLSGVEAALPIHRLMRLLPLAVCTLLTPCHAAHMRFRVLFLLLTMTLMSRGQDAAPPVDAKPSPLITLRALVDSMAALNAQLAQQNQRAKTGESDAIKEAAKKEAGELHQRLGQAQRDFEAIATGVSEPEQQQAAAVKFDLANEVNDLLGPMVLELKTATEQPRVIERLREELAFQQKRAEQAKQAVEELDATLKSVPRAKDGTPEAALRRALLDTQSKWKNAITDAQGRVETARYRLNDAIANRKSLWQTLSLAAKAFFLKRGLNLVLAVLVFFGVSLAWRAMHQWFAWISPWHTGATQRPFAARVLDVGYHAMALVMGTLAALLVLYVQGDWLLLGLSLIALLGLLLAAKNGLPKYYTQARLLVNLGEVREGERVVVNGLPWQVKSINMFTDLINPALRNGLLRLPIAQVVGMGSRPTSTGEPWFPCKEDDWVLLADGTFGKAVCLTPEFVQLVQLGGAFKTYTTPGFVGQNPVTFANGFRVSAIVKVHPDHRADALKTIPEAVQATIEKGLATLVEPDQVRSVKVEFRAVIPAALEFDVVADFDGEAAEKYPTLQRAVQRFCLQALNANQWKLGG